MTLFHPRLEILPAEQRVWYDRKRRTRETADGSISIGTATIPDYIAAIEDWRGRNATLLAARCRLAERKAAREAADHRATMALLDALHARDAERDAEEAAAAAREV